MGLAQSQTFRKDYATELRYDLIPPEVLQALAEVYTYGEKKYGADNWKKATWGVGPSAKDTDRFYGALMRHMEAHRKGELYDSESGLLHVSHALTNISFITVLTMQNQKQKPASTQPAYSQLEMTQMGELNTFI